MDSRFSYRWVLLLALFLISSRAQAQRTNDPAVTQRALALLRQADAAFDVSDFETALRAYQQAYQLQQDPPILHNVARVLARMGRDEEAAETWRTFLSRARDVPNREAIEQLVREALQRAEQRRARANQVVEPPRVVEAPTPVVQSETVWPVGAIVLTAVGGAGVLSSGVFAGVYAGGINALQAPQNCTRAQNGSYDCDPSARMLAEQSVLFGNTAWIAAGVGGALTTAGLVWLFVGRRTRRVELSPTASLVLDGVRVRW